MTFHTEIKIELHRNINYSQTPWKLWAFTGLIFLISNMVIQRSFTGVTNLLSANVRGPVSFAVSVFDQLLIHKQAITWPMLTCRLDHYELTWINLYLNFSICFEENARWKRLNNDSHFVKTCWDKVGPWRISTTCAMPVMRNHTQASRWVSKKKKGF